ncbi:MAG TPA: hypothetical protein VN436_02430, partial [Holophaga sp.]|nr:hypothetical protein [Holophaga sp.]
MRYIVSNLSVRLGEETGDPRTFLARALGAAPEDFQEVVLERRSLDARHKGAIHFLMTLSFGTDLDLAGRTLPPGVRLEAAPGPLDWTVAALGRKPRVVVVGTGPAGTFCALRLLDYGLEPVVLE